MCGSVTGLMHEPKNGEIGFAGNREICCAPPYQFIEFSLKAKERNSGAIILYSCRSIQVTIAGRCRNSVANSLLKRAARDVPFSKQNLAS